LASPKTKEESYPKKKWRTIHSVERDFDSSLLTTPTPEPLAWDFRAARDSDRPLVGQSEKRKKKKQGKVSTKKRKKRVHQEEGRSGSAITPHEVFFLSLGHDREDRGSFLFFFNSRRALFFPGRGCL
jgi:hypothetical protein